MSAPRARRRSLLLLAAGLALAAGTPRARAQLRSAGAQERQADAEAFATVQQALTERLTDIDSVAVVLRGRIAYEFYRDGAPDRLRDVQSVEKSALSALAGIALAQGHLRSLDQPVVAVVPEWAALNADPRSREITLRHLLTMTPGFDVGDLANTPRKLPAAQAWARPLAAAPGTRFAYDNSMTTVLTTVLEKASGLPLPEYARLQLVQPLGMAEPGYRQVLHLRTLDMAKLGQLFLRDGEWDGRQLLSREYVRAASSVQDAGGPPVGMPYGLMWWVLPHEAPRRTFMASGWGGQLVWVYPPLDLVVAVTSRVTPDSQRRGHAAQLLRGGLVEAAHRLAAPGR